MRHYSRYLTWGLGLTMALTVSAEEIAGQSCALEYYRADNMWADWGRADGYLGAETLTLQPGLKKVFNGEWANEKKRNDGTTYYGSHLRRAINRGSGPISLRVGGPGHYLWLLAGEVQVFFWNIDKRVAIGPGQELGFRHDLLDVSCPAAAPAPPPAPQPAPVLLSLTGERTLTSATVTVTAKDAKTGAPLTGQVTINGVSGATGQPVTYTRCTETLEYEDTRGVTRTRTVRAACEGTVKINGYPDASFTF